MAIRIIILVFISVTAAFSQAFIQGKVLTQPDKTPIAYVNIGISGAGIGTISNEDGSFTLKLPAGHLSDTLLFSAIGYGRRRVPVSLLSKKQIPIIYLEEKAVVLESVVVSAKKEKPKLFELGNRYFKGGNIAGDSIYAGAVYTLLIENKFPSYHKDLSWPAYLKSVKLRIFKNNLDSFKFRVRLFDVDSLSGEPGNDLVTQNIIIESDIKSGWLDADLTQLQFRITKPFYIGFEWILNDKTREDIIHKFVAYKKQHPEKTTMDTVLLDGKKTVLSNLNWDDFPGTALSASPIQFSRDHYKSYVRNSSFASWDRTNVILTTRVVISDTPTSNKVAVPTAEKDPPLPRARGGV